ncbi:MAG TPA: Fur family transcriptional regulator, partial [Candidatus Nanoperiomorbaceae bacterium]|nr:Fur family transcriptional regulator [Candidatus Nanoperiomorbaceae bacterium]
MEHLEELLRTSGNRLTNPRRQVFTALQQADEPLSLQRLLALAPGTDRTSIYRTLELYEQLHIIDIVHIGWKKRYELADPFKPHHHHLQCTKCHELIAIDTPELEQLISIIAKKHNYTITDH